MRKRFIGDRAFYKRLLAVALPIIAQNGITNMVSLLDNIMVGQVGTAQMSGVAIVNQLLFVFNLCIFGAVAGGGIFTAQFFGSGDHEGVGHTFRFKVLACLLLAVAGIAVFWFAGAPLIQLYLRGEDGSSAEALLSLESGLAYLHIMLVGLLPFALNNAYSSTLRETGHAIVPMVAGVAAVLVNLGLNYVLIFGNFGAPALGVQGAAIATVISRYVELAICAGWSHLSKKVASFMQGVYRSVYIPARLMKTIAVKGMPLMLNEAAFGMGMAFLSQCYSVRGLDVVAAINICSTLNNLSSVVYMTLGHVAGILIGQMLGAGRSEDDVRDTFRKIVAFSVVSCLLFGGMMAGISGLFPGIYNTTQSARSLASQLICICALLMPVGAYIHCVYFTLRSGGKTVITFVFDSGFLWACSVPLAYCLSRFTKLPIVPLFALCQGVDFLKCILGFFMIRGKSWIQNLTHA